MKTKMNPQKSNQSVSKGWASLALAGVVAGVAVQAGAQSLSRSFQAFPPALTNKIKYVIIIYPENRSFDSLYGKFPGANGLANATDYTQYGRSNNTALASLIQPTTAGMSLISAGPDARFPSSMLNSPVDTSAYVLDNYVIGDMTHLFYLEQYQINNTNYTWLSNDPKNVGGPAMSKYSVWGSNPGLVLSYYDEQNGGEGAIAKQFVLADNCFHSAFGGSFLNHQFLIAARAPIWNAAAYPSIGAAVTPKDPNSTNFPGEWFPAATGSGNGIGPTLADNALTPDPTLPGFPYSNNSTNINPGDYWAVNTIRPLQGPYAGLAVPGTAPYLNYAVGANIGLNFSVTAKTPVGGTNVFGSTAMYAPFSVSAMNTLLPPQTYDTIGDRLNAANVSWAWFSGGWNNAKSGYADFLFQFHHQPFVYFSNYAFAHPPIYPINGSTNAPVPAVDSVDPNGAPVGYGIGSANHLLDEDADFYRMLDAGTLPQVSFVKPIGEDNSHPGYASVKRGQAWVANIVGRIRNSPVWPNCVVFVMYDEHGGLWDHVVPPVVDRWGPGTRIPFIIASPWSKRGIVDHNQYETDSLLAFIEGLYNLPPLNYHDANALPPVAAFAGQPDLFLETTVNENVNYTIPAFFPAGITPVSFAWSGNSDGLLLDSITGLIYGTPASTGTYTVNVTVTGTPGPLPGQQNIIKYVLQIDTKATPPVLSQRNPIKRNTLKNVLQNDLN